MKEIQAAVQATSTKRVDSVESVSVEQPKTRNVCVEIEGTATLIQNAFPQKAVEQMLRKHMGIANIREKKKPREVIESAMIRNTDGRICIPPQGIKAAMLSASANLKGFKVKQLMTGIFLVGQSVPITFEKMTPRMDITRVGTFPKQPDVRFRPEFHGWRARFLLRFADQFDTQTVVDLVNRSGTVGVGEWRPEKRGVHGSYQVSRIIGTAKEAEEVRAECFAPIKGWTIPEWAMDQEIDMEALAKMVEDQGEEKEGEKETG